MFDDEMKLLNKSRVPSTRKLPLGPACCAALCSCAISIGMPSRAMHGSASGEPASCVSKLCMPSVSDTSLATDGKTERRAAVSVAACGATLSVCTLHTSCTRASPYHQHTYHGKARSGLQGCLWHAADRSQARRSPEDTATRVGVVRRRCIGTHQRVCLLTAEISGALQQFP
jgi:hypothetical protein